MEGATRVPESEPEDRLIRRSLWVFGGALGALALLVGARIATGGGPLEWLALGLVAVAGMAAVANLTAVRALEARRRTEAESVARLLRGLSRSVSPDAIVAAIADELGAVVDADHVVVVRRRGDPDRVEAMLVSRRPGVPSSTTTLPASDLDDPLERPTIAGLPGGAAVPVGGSAPVPVGVPVATTAEGAEGAGRPVAGTNPMRQPERRERGDPAMPDARRPHARHPHAQAHPGPDLAGRGRRSRDGDRAREERVARITEHVADRLRSAYGLRETIAAPLLVGDSVAGALVLSRRLPGPWSPAARRLLDEAAAEASFALDRAQSYRRAETEASTDALTGLPNRRYFDEFCGLLARRRRAGDALGAMMVDIDHFKRLNDTFGHAAGDEVLRAVAGAIAGAVREEDLPARFGGEEFVVLLRNPSADVAAAVGERVRRSVGALDLASLGVPGVTVSVGVAMQAGADQPVAEVVEAADQALYRAKRAGRDRVVVAG